jgi:hypothetical protein
MEEYLLKGIQTSTGLSKMFFSDSNVANISNRLRLEVFRATGKRIGPLSSMTLREHMRNNYVEFARNNDSNSYSDNLKAVTKLNNTTINMLLKNLISAVREYVDNLVDLDNPNGVYIPNIPINASNKGKYPLRSQSDILFGDSWK